MAKENKNAVQGAKVAVALGNALKGMGGGLFAAIGAVLVAGGMGVEAYFDGDETTLVSWDAVIFAAVGLATTIMAKIGQKKAAD